MTIEQLDKTKLFISLCSQDMKDFALDFDTMNLWDDHSRKVISRLLHLAGNKTGIALEDKSILIEAIPFDLGCVLLVSLLEKIPKRKVYKVKRNKSVPAVRFDDAEALMRCALVIYKHGITLNRNSLWFLKGAYYIVFDYPYISEKARCIMGEFGSVLSLGRNMVATLKERGKVVCKGDAINTIGKRISG